MNRKKKSSQRSENTDLKKNHEGSIQSFNICAIKPQRPITPHPVLLSTE